MGSLWSRLRPRRRRPGAKTAGRASSHVSQAGWWEAQWSRPDMAAQFLGRPVSPQIVASVEEGWLPRGGHVLDAGCGEGAVAAWMAEQGFTALGIDIAPSAIERARALHPESDALRFDAADLRRDRVSERPFDVLIDRGCLHQMRNEDLPPYVANLTSMSSPDARMLIFYRAYRDGIAQGDPAERRRVVERVTGAYAGRFSLERVEDAWIDPRFGADPATRLGGIVLWLERVRARGSSA